MARFWTSHWRFRYWRPDVNREGQPVRSSASNSFTKRGVSVGDIVYVISLAAGQLYLGGRMTVKRIVSRSEAVRLWKNDNLYDAEEWIVDPEQTGTLLHLHRRLSPDLTKQLRFESKAGPREPFFISDTELDKQATRGVRELTPESAALLDRIIEITDRLPRSDQLITVTEELLRNGKVQEGTDEVRLPEEKPSGTGNHAFAVPPVQEYVAAFQDVGNLNDVYLQMLKVHYYAPNRTITATQLSQAVGYANYGGANLHYGRLGRLIGERLGSKFEMPLEVLVTFQHPGDEWEWIMRPQVAEALEELGWVILAGGPTANTPGRERSAGAGFGNSESNKLVEQAAIAFVQSWYQAEGWSVESVEREKCGYDLMCRRSSEEEHAEVKGTRGPVQAFVITAGEVSLARMDPRFRLCVVTDALSKIPSLDRYSGQEFLSCFSLDPVQYRAVGSAKKLARMRRLRFGSR